MSEAVILHVEDSSDYRLIMQLAFGRKGLSLRQCVSAEAALEILKSAEFKLAIVDFYLSGMDGLEFCRLLKRDYPEIKIALISAVSRRLLPERALDLNIDLILTKPLRPSDYEALFSLAL